MEACYKKRYETSSFAKKKLKELNKTNGGKLKRVYWCEQCTSYHITTQTKEQYEKFKTT